MGRCGDRALSPIDDGLALVEPGETSGALRWRLVPGQLLRARQWDDEVVVYNDLSGDTHLIDAAAMAILRALQAAPDGMEFSVDADDELLGTLASNSLIEPASC